MTLIGSSESMYAARCAGFTGWLQLHTHSLRCWATGMVASFAGLARARSFDFSREHAVACLLFRLKNGQTSVPGLEAGASAEK
jgi:hypothetical protein